ncbi:TPR end-of-group domain-containing protein [Lutimonas sp.]|uniref:gliding motility protein GldB-related protein n=1 Tax=Lutimonas sp. TaxID=1872403 RepID=UPI003D9B6982
MKKLLCSGVLLFLCGQLLAQEQKSAYTMSQEADQLYMAKNYGTAASNYLKVIELSDFAAQKRTAAYNAACCLALEEKIDSSFILLNEAIDHGYSNKFHLSSDSDLTSLHQDGRWEELLNRVPASKTLNSDPEKASIITSDVHHFWEAYDLVQEDTAHARAIYKRYYFDKASDGMQDYMGLKVASIDKFTQHIQSHPKLYTSIRKNTLKVEAYKEKIQTSFNNFKAIYPDAKFPDVYFVIGAFTSGGTISNAGLLIGTNQMSDGEGVNTDELSDRTKLLMNQSKYIPNIVSHELIHFQQNHMKRDTITLGYAIKEGMADFMGELISGNSANEKIFAWAEGKEKKIWEDFKKDMYYNRSNNWIANYSTVSEDGYPDLGYWVGYEICKSYYENSKDKEQAIYDMLHIRNYKKFLEDSKWERKVKRY